MKLSKRLEEALNEQVRFEIESSYTYKGMRLFFEDQGIPGFAHWFKKQEEEELEHSEEFIDFIQSYDGKVTLGDIKAQPTEYGSFLEVFETGLKHEEAVSEAIVKLLEIAIEDKNYAAENFLRKFVDEQLEEEDTYRGVINMIKFAGDDKAALFNVDHILAKR